ncbi:hypothetical protein JVU11DRAFT_8255 [Chiua virens]|nr:hypothetical protein JVU11DRAFT_8255 [Chiua virens]
MENEEIPSQQTCGKNEGPSLDHEGDVLVGYLNSPLPNSSLLPPSPMDSRTLNHQMYIDKGKQHAVSPDWFVDAFGGEGNERLSKNEEVCNDPAHEDKDVSPGTSEKETHGNSVDEGEENEDATPSNNEWEVHPGPISAADKERCLALGVKFTEDIQELARSLWKPTRAVLWETGVLTGDSQKTSLYNLYRAWHSHHKGQVDEAPFTEDVWGLNLKDHTFPWIQWLEFAWKGKCHIVNWPNGVPAPGPSMNVRNLSTSDTCALVQPFVENARQGCRGAKEVDIVSWSKDEIDLNNHSSVKKKIPLMCDVNLTALYMLGDCVHWKEWKDKQRYRIGHRKGVKHLKRGNPSPLEDAESKSSHDDAPLTRVRKQIRCHSMQQGLGSDNHVHPDHHAPSKVVTTLCPVKLNKRKIAILSSEDPSDPLNESTGLEPEQISTSRKVDDQEPDLSTVCERLAKLKQPVPLACVNDKPKKLVESIFDDGNNLSGVESPNKYHPARKPRHPSHDRSLPPVHQSQHSYWPPQQSYYPHFPPYYGPPPFMPYGYPGQAGPSNPKPKRYRVKRRISPVIKSDMEEDSK